MNLVQHLLSNTNPKTILERLESHYGKDRLESLLIENDISILSFRKNGPTYRNAAWHIIQKEELSILWLLTGFGNPQDKNHPELLPTTNVIEGGVGVRLIKEQEDKKEGYFSDDLLEFIQAVESQKSHNKTAFINLTDIFDIFMRLGYTKTKSCFIKTQIPQQVQ